MLKKNPFHSPCTPITIQNLRDLSRYVPFEPFLFKYFLNILVIFPQIKFKYFAIFTYFFSPSSYDHLIISRFEKIASADYIGLESMKEIDIVHQALFSTFDCTYAHTHLIMVISSTPRFPITSCIRCKKRKKKQNP